MADFKESSFGLSKVTGQLFSFACAELPCAAAPERKTLAAIAWGAWLETATSCSIETASSCWRWEQIRFLAGHAELPLGVENPWGILCRCRRKPLQSQLLNIMFRGFLVLTVWNGRICARWLWSMSAVEYLRMLTCILSSRKSLGLKKSRRIGVWSTQLEVNRRTFLGMAQS